MKYEQKYLDEGYDFVIGIDEAGRGPLAGPVVACAACYMCHPELDSGSQEILMGSRNEFGMTKSVQYDKMWELIKDSKLLSEKQREELFDFIHEHFYVGVGICDHKTIDRINILEATFLAMKKAITDLGRRMANCHPELVSGSIKDNKRCQNRSRIKSGMTNQFGIAKKYIILVDGNKTIPNISLEQEAIVGGDNLVKSISAASIIAKVTRDRIMKNIHEKYPEYNFLQHKGYGTKLHMEMIQKYGPCEIHRKSFKPFSI